MSSVNSWANIFCYFCWNFIVGCCLVQKLLSDRYHFIPHCYNYIRSLYDIIIIIIIIIITKVSTLFTEILYRVLEFFCLLYAHTFYVVRLNKEIRKQYILNNQILFEYSGPMRCNVVTLGGSDV